jgi:hypothetical protein
MYILDTSALRSISKANLEKGCAKYDVRISTITALELASHLNDTSETKQFLLNKVNFLKCKFPTLLHDPFWEFSKRIDALAQTNPTRQDDMPILIELIRVMDGVYTLDELSNQYLSYPGGEKVSCENIGATISAMLAEEENSYVSHVNYLASKLKLDTQNNGSHTLTADNLLQILISCADETAGRDNSNLRAKTFFAIALYSGYVISRLYGYVNKRQFGEESLSIEKNDCEDAYICLHLDLDRDDILVTNDKGTLAALRQTLSLLTSCLPAEINQLRAINVEEFVGRLQLELQ